jgi:hypothetical protein
MLQECRSARYRQPPQQQAPIQRRDGEGKAQCQPDTDTVRADNPAPNAGRRSSIVVKIVSAQSRPYLQENISRPIIYRDKLR